MLGQASNPMLQKAEAALASHVKPELKASLEKVIHAGLNILYSPQLAEGLQHRINTGHNPPEDAGKGATRMMYELYQQSKGTLPKGLLVTGAIIFAFEYLDLLAKAGKVKITPELIAETTTATGDAMLAAMKVTPEKLTKMIESGKGATKPAGIIGAAQGGA